MNETMLVGDVLVTDPYRPGIHTLVTQGDIVRHVATGRPGVFQGTQDGRVLVTFGPRDVVCEHPSRFGLVVSGLGTCGCAATSTLDGDVIISTMPSGCPIHQGGVSYNP